MIDNYSITIEKYRWGQDSSPEDINFFSSASRELIGTLDVAPYLISLGEIEYSFENVSTEGYVSETSTVKLKLSGIKDDYFIPEFFNIGSTPAERNYIKYKLIITEKVTNNVLYEGIFNNEYISESFSDEENSNIVEINAIGYDKEFKNYYINKGLPNEQASPPEISFPILVNGIEGIRWIDAFHIIFSDGTYILLDVDENIIDWYIARNPILAQPSSGCPLEVVFLKSSYNRIRNSGENKYLWLKKLCTSMGWVMYFKGARMQIRNRSSLEGYSLELPVENVISYELTSKPYLKYENILLINGAISAGAGTWGAMTGAERIILLTAKDYVGKSLELAHRWNANWWKDMLNYPALVPPYDPEWRYMHYWNEDSDIFRYKITKPRDPNYQNFQTIPQNRMLRIHGGDTGEHAWKYRTDTGAQAPVVYSSSPPTYEIHFKGNYGESMFRVSDYVVTLTYMYYADTSQFYNNLSVLYEGLLNEGSVTASVKYHGIVDDFQSRISFVGVEPTRAGYLTGGNWFIKSIKLNLAEGTTVMDITQILNLI